MLLRINGKFHVLEVRGTPWTSDSLWTANSGRRMQPSSDMPEAHVASCCVPDMKLRGTGRQATIYSISMEEVDNNNTGILTIWIWNLMIPAPNMFTLENSTELANWLWDGFISGIPAAVKRCRFFLFVFLGPFLPEDSSDILSEKLPWARTYPSPWRGNYYMSEVTRLALILIWNSFLVF